MSWLYLPGSAECSLDSSSQIPKAGSSVTSRGRRLSPRSLSSAWRNKPWMKRLCGLMLKPSMAARGVARWIASLPGCLASPSPPLGNGVGAPTNGGSGPASAESSGRSNRARSSSKTSRTCYEWDLAKSTMTFEEWVSGLRRASSRRRKSALRTRGDDSSFWPTPIARDGRRLREPLSKWLGTLTGPKEYVPLSMAVKLWASHFRQGRGATGTESTFDPLLNPAFSEWLMGLPIRWTDSAASVTRSFQLWRRLHTELLQRLLERDDSC